MDLNTFLYYIIHYFKSFVKEMAHFKAHFLNFPPRGSKTIAPAPFAFVYAEDKALTKRHFPFHCGRLLPFSIMKKAFRKNIPPKKGKSSDFLKNRALPTSLFYHIWRRLSITFLHFFSYRSDFCDLCTIIIFFYFFLQKLFIFHKLYVII